MVNNTGRSFFHGIHEIGVEEMAMSIIQTKATKECFLCRFEKNIENTQDLEKHHFMHGTANRRLAERWGLWGYLCRKHHTEGPEAVHNNREKDFFLQQVAQGRFEKLYGHEKWMEIFRKNYIF